MNKRLLPAFAIVLVAIAAGEWLYLNSNIFPIVWKIENNAVVEGRMEFASGSKGLGWLRDSRSGAKLFVVFPENGSKEDDHTGLKHRRIRLRGTRGYFFPGNDPFIVREYETVSRHTQPSRSPGIKT